ncbi:unnamed protein product [Clavelina lepadiformis]|uniref:Fanconi anemia group M protein n=1 Tax=Clavelina lepadiformis TaxID=159417 RepID=A0ABP0GNL0_CLALP
MPKPLLRKTQKTLFESWKKKDPENPKLEKKNICGPFPASSNFNAKPQQSKRNQQCLDVINISEDEIGDEDLLSATVALERTLNDRQKPSSTVIEDIPGFDKFSGNLWIYPTNYPVREYQYFIVKTALFKNTLVALPTGLGKTFIAAVVMYNFYRWYPQGKVVFMAPTKPLVAQQIDACYNIMGIPMEDQTQITGATMASNRRSELWNSKRVFFVTPQVINNDLTRGVCPATEIKCLVVDEAHKALGNHAYCQVVQQLLAHTRDFRVLALSATPGSDLKTVQQVITNLLISHIELRSEEAVDIQQYTHSRNIEKFVVKLTDKILKMKEKYLSVIQMFINCLVNNKVIFNKDAAYFSKYALLMARDQYRKDPPTGLSRNTMGTVEGTFAILISLYHGLELLVQHGLKSFFIFLKGLMEGEKGNVRAKTSLHANESFREIYNELIDLFGSSPGSVVLLTQTAGTQYSKKAHSDVVARPYVYSHPKMQKLEEVVLNHFQKARTASEQGTGIETRVMVFCQYRDTVREITELLQMHRPLVRPMQFVGHAPSTNPKDDAKSGTKCNRRFTQKDQLMVVSKFRSGDYNTLVSTCVGEEGLDIGDVDLIICFDSHKSPIRLVQRMGRTGRKRKGKIVMLVTEGKEERDYNSSLASRRSIHKAILGAGKTLHYYPHNPAMIPRGLMPQCHKMFMTVATKPNKEKKKPTKQTKKETPGTSKDVSVMLKKKWDSTFLNKQQMENYRKNLQLTQEESKQLKKLPVSGMCLYLQKDQWGQTASQTNLSLNEWLPWQTRLQQTKYIEHSTRTKTFAELLEVSEVIKQSNQETFEKNLAPLFGAMVDTEQSTVVKAGISKYLKSLEKKQKLKSQKRKKEELFIISDDEVNCVGDNSIDLPAFDLTDDADELNNEMTSNVVIHKDDNTCPSFKQSDVKSTTDEKRICGDGSQICKEMEIKYNCKSCDSTSKKNEQCLELQLDNSNFNSNTENFAKTLFQKDSLSSFSANLPALCVTPTQTEGGSKFDFDCASKNQSESDSDPKSVSPLMESIAFDYSDDSDSKNTKTAKPTCFKLWDAQGTDKARKGSIELKSEEDLDTKIPKKESLDFFENNSASVTTDEGLCGRQVDETKLDKTTSFSISDMDEIPNDEAEQFKDDIELPIRLTHAHQSLSLNKEDKSIKPNCNMYAAQVEPAISTVMSPRPINVEPFDMSADMFAPEFDLDFDLGCGTPLAEKKMESKSNNDDSTANNTCNKHEPTAIKGSDSKDATVTHIRQTSALANCDEPTIPPILTTTEDTIASISISQTNRKENRTIFAELNANVANSNIPFASVKPQVISPSNREKSNDTSTTSNTTRSGNELSNSEKKFKLHVKRRRVLFSEPADCSLIQDEDDDFADFQTKPLLKRRRLEQSIWKDVSSDCDSIHSPIAATKRRARMVISSPGVKLHAQRDIQGQEANNEIEDSFKMQTSLVADSPVFKKRGNKLHIQSLKESPGLMTDLNCNMGASAFLKHSTPKVFLSGKNESLAEKRVPVSTTSLKSSKTNKQVKSRRPFIFDEAEVSTDGAVISSDEECDDDVTDEEMLAFVNDATQLTQHVNDHDSVPNEEAMYLQSIKSPFNKQSATGRYRLAYDVGRNVDVFSQVPEQDVSDYLEDSFCVVGEEEEHDTEIGEITMLGTQEFNLEESETRPRTRGQVKSRQINECNSGKVRKSATESKKRRRIICDEESDANNTETDANGSDALVINFCSPVEKILETSNQETSTNDIPGTSSRKVCEICGGVITSKGWLCKNCVDVMKQSKEEHKQIIKSEEKTLKTKQVPPVKVRLPATLRMTREERLKKSREKQLEFRKRQGQRRNSLHQNFAIKQQPSNNTDQHNSTPPDIDIGPAINKKLLFAESSPNLERHGLNKTTTHNTIVTSSNSPKFKPSEKLLILVDSREVNSGSVQLVQALRTKHNINVVVASLRGSSFAVSKRAAVIRKTTDDISTVSKKINIAAQMQKVCSYFRKVYLIVEKNRVKKGWVNKTSASHSANFTSNLVSISHGNVRVLHSNDQEQSAYLLQSLAMREYHAGHGIEGLMVQSASKHQQMISIYSNIPGITFISACYLAGTFKSLKAVLFSSADELSNKAAMTEQAARNLLKFLCKKFDVQMTPL